MLSLIALLNSIPAVVYGALAIIAAVFLDALLGEPKRWHLLAGFGWLANQIERKLNRGNFRFTRTIGMLAWLILITPFTVLAYVTTHSPFSWLIEVALLYFSLGTRSLIQHAQNVYTPLMQSDIHSARQAVSLIVSRDTSRHDETEIVKATVESVLENGNDAVFGAIFWFVMLGGTGALLFRLANTLDAMWGYRTPRFLLFGWASARMDDGLNLIPARLTALSYAICGHTRSAIQCWRTQAGNWYSPNAGPVMASGAGALQIKLGGAAIYHGQLKQRPMLGMGEIANPQHIISAIGLVKRSLFLWCVLIAFASLLRSLCFA